MPLYDFRCVEPDCQAVHEEIVKHDVVAVPCRHCGRWSWRQLSAPGGLRCHGAQGGMVLTEREMKKIKEPVWQDQKTGTITSAF